MIKQAVSYFAIPKIRELYRLAQQQNMEHEFKDVMRLFETYHRGSIRKIHNIAKQTLPKIKDPYEALRYIHETRGAKWGVHLKAKHFLDTEHLRKSIENLNLYNEWRRFIKRAPNMPVQDFKRISTFF